MRPQRCAWQGRARPPMKLCMHTSCLRLINRSGLALLRASERDNAIVLLLWAKMLATLLVVLPTHILPRLSCHSTSPKIRACQCPARRASRRTLRTSMPQLPPCTLSLDGEP